MRKPLTLDQARISKQRSYFLVEFKGSEATHERPMDTLTEALAFCRRWGLEVVEITGLKKPVAPVPNF